MEKTEWVGYESMTMVDLKLEIEMIIYKNKIIEILNWKCGR